MSLSEVFIICWPDWAGESIGFFLYRHTGVPKVVLLNLEA